MFGTYLQIEIRKVTIVKAVLYSFHIITNMLIDSLFILSVISRLLSDYQYWR